MTLPLRIHPGAQAEAEAAIEWYRARSHHAAVDFLSALRSTLIQISRDPLLFPRYLMGTRRVVLRRFPYTVVFFRTKTGVDIIAVAHGRRRPGYWRERTL